MTSQMRQPVQRLLSILYKLMWVFPAYFISFLVSCSWYEEIASRTYALHFGRRREVKTNFIGFVLVLRDEAWRCVPFGHCGLACCVLAALPPVRNITLLFV